MKNKFGILNYTLLIFLSLHLNSPKSSAGEFEDWISSLTNFNSNQEECFANKCRVNLAECLTHGDHCMPKGIQFTQEYCREKFKICCENTGQTSICNGMIDELKVPRGSVYDCRKAVCQNSFNRCMADCKNRCFDPQKELFCERRCREMPCREIYNIGPYPTTSGGISLNESTK